MVRNNASSATTSKNIRDLAKEEIKTKRESIVAAMFEASEGLPDCKDYVMPPYWTQAVARNDPLREHWIRAMQDEYGKLLKRKTFEYISIDEAKKDPKYGLRGLRLTPRVSRTS